jgi:Ca2+-binding RTX toxin-like protein
VVGSDNNDSIFGSSVGNLLSGGRGDDDISGNAGDDYIFGGEGRDTVEGGVGADSMNGGGDIDTLSYLGSDAGVTANLATGLGQGGHAQGDGFVGFENLTGSRFDDKLIGNGADNVLTGGAGRDVLTGGGGHDIFKFSGRGSLVDSTVASPDFITDFVRGEDLIDVRHINRTYGADEAMGLVSVFTGAGNEMTVSVQANSTMILGDRDGDKIADFAIQLAGAVHLTADDFIL